MARLHLLTAAAALSVLSLASSARAELPVEGPPASPGSRAAAPQEEAPMLPGGVMRALNALVVVGVVEIDRSSTLISSTGVTDTARLPVRDPIWVSPEPPKMPLFFSRVVQLKF
jgi:hypothetical protein